MRINSNSQPLRPVVVLGAFPPPLHGMAAINNAVYELFIASGLDATKINLSAYGTGGVFVRRLKKIFYALFSFVKYMKFLSNYKFGIVYVGLSGGFGQVLELLFIFFARLRGWSVVLHHHSFAYLDHFSFVTQFLFWSAGKSALHIALCETMKEKILSRYGDDVVVNVLSNTSFYENVKQRNGISTGEFKRFGFLSNICEEKGVFEFIDSIERLSVSMPGVSGVLAGPFVSESMSSRVIERIQNSNCVTYVGPKYGNEKIEFFQNIDVFVFPTKYKNEAEPLVVIEALSFGLPIICYGRGCLESLSSNSVCVVAFEVDSDFPSQFVRQILQWNSKKISQELSDQAVLTFEILMHESKNNLYKLLSSLIQGFK